MKLVTGSLSRCILKLQRLIGSAKACMVFFLSCDSVKKVARLYYRGKGRAGGGGGERERGGERT